MSEKTQILFIQTRLIRLASEKWNTTIIKANAIFAKYNIFKFIEECFEEFGAEGDEAVFEDIELLLHNLGVEIDSENN